MKHASFLLITLLFATAAPLQAMDNELPADDGRPAKRRRDNNNDQPPGLANAAAQFLMLACKGELYDLQREEQEARATIEEDMEHMMGDGTFDCLCGSRFNHSDHGIILMPCGLHRICETCALEILRPDKRRPATPRPCPVCRHEPEDAEAMIPLLDIALRQATRGELDIPLEQVQRLHTTRAAYDGHDIDADSEDTQGEDLDDTDGEEEENDEEEDGSGYDSSFIDDEGAEEENAVSP